MASYLPGVIVVDCPVLTSTNPREAEEGGSAQLVVSTGVRATFCVTVPPTVAPGNTVTLPPDVTFPLTVAPGNNVMGDTLERLSTVAGVGMERPSGPVWVTNS